MSRIAVVCLAYFPLMCMANLNLKSSVKFFKNVQDENKRDDFSLLAFNLQTKRPEHAWGILKDL